MELVSWEKLDAQDLLAFLEEQRTTHLLDRTLRARLRAIGKNWLEVKKKVSLAINESGPFLKEFHETALGMEKAAHHISNSFLKPVPNKSREVEIAMSKQSIVAFFKARQVRNTNQYGWLLLQAVFGDNWRAGHGKDQIQAFRKIPKPPYVRRVRSREDFDIVMERGKLGWFRMLKGERNKRNMGPGAA
jgi:hypothetical protein